MDLSRHVSKADEAVGRRNFDAAIVQYQHLLDLQPDLGDARAGLRRALAGRAKKRGKTGGFFAALNSLPSRLALPIFRWTKKHARVAALYEKMLVHDPFNEALNLRLADALERGNHNASALAVLAFLGETEDPSAHALRRAGAVCYRQGEMDRALEFYERSLEIEPRNHDAIKARKNLAAEGALRSGGLDTAGSSRDLISDKDAQAGLEASRRVHRTDAQLKEERATAEAALAENPDDIEQLLALAQAATRLEDLDGAVDALQRAVAAAPDSEEAASRLGQARRSQLDARVKACEAAGDADGLAGAQAERDAFLLAEAERLVAQRPTDLGLRLKYGKLLLRGGRVDDAIAELQRVTQDERHRVDGLTALARCFLKKGHPDLATQQLDAALEGLADADGRAKEILYNLGLIAERQGQRDLARGHFARVYAVDITYRDVAIKMETATENTETTD